MSPDKRSSQPPDLGSSSLDTGLHTVAVSTLEGITLAVESSFIKDVSNLGSTPDPALPRVDAADLFGLSAVRRSSPSRRVLHLVTDRSEHRLVVGDDLTIVPADLSRSIELSPLIESVLRPAGVRALIKLGAGFSYLLDPFLIGEAPACPETSLPNN